ncbi:MAG: rod shape-determining protein MreD [Elusimicrobiota bacterium]|jgi:rod shape-determining protein MreD|nr:rod shape-determining protein MreD [Elusimicrobiota bacterium]
MNATVYYISIYAFTWFLHFFLVGKYVAVGGICPNFALTAVIFLSLFRAEISGMVLSFVIGLTWDVYSLDIFGLRALVFTTINYLCSVLMRNIYCAKISTQCLIVFLASVSYSIIISFVLHYTNHNSMHFPFDVGILLGSAVTAVFSPAVFWVFNKIADAFYLNSNFGEQ